MKRGLKIVFSWLCMLSLFASPLTALGAGTTSGDPVWPNPGAIQLSKTAEPTGNPGEWKITLKAEGKNLKTSSDVVLVIDKSGSMDNRDGYWDKDYRLANAKTAAKKFVDNLLLPESSNKIAVVAFNKTSSLVSDFKGATQKESLKSAIDGINAEGGTNIQAGLKQARELLAGSSAQNKIIVVLSDGEPTYSYKGTEASSFSWPNNSYNYSINKFDYGKILGTGGNFAFVDYDCFFGFCKNDTYSLNNFKVKDNGIGTISEAKIAKAAGLKIFSVGLDVSNNSNAIKVLKDVQSDGYFSASSDELNTIFREMAGKISYAAQNAKVIDPMGDMFNLKLKGAKISPEDYTVSQGSVTWDAAAEKFTWDVGNIAEGEPAIFTYTVIMDQSKNPVSDVLYPTNGTTTIDYTDVNNRNVTREFEVPKVSVGKGSILVKGYKVNANGKPVNAEGKEVEAPEYAVQLYSETFKDQNGKEALQIGSTHSVQAKTVDGFKHQVGDSPRTVTITVTNPSPVVWFGYAEAVEQTVTVKYVEKGSNKEIRESTIQKGLPGSKVTLEALPVAGYSVVAPDKVDYTFTSEPNQVHTFFYTADAQSVVVKYLEKGTENELSAPETKNGVTDETLKLEAKEIAGYTVVGEATVNYKLGVENEPHIFYYKANVQNVTVKYVDRATGDELSKATSVEGATGKTVTLEAVEVPGYTPENATFEYTFKAEGNEYVFYYTADKQSVVVQYLEEGTDKVLSPPETKNGVTDETLKLEAKEIAGYTVVGEATVNYKLGVDNKPHIFYYTANVQNVTVKYVDRATGDELSKATSVEGATGKTVTLEAVEVPGYTPENATFEYTFKAEGNEYVFYYTADKQSVVVQYLEEGTDKVLSPPETKNGVTDETLKLEAKEIAGYTVVGEATVNYKLGVDNKPHIFYYTANVQNVTVKYVDRATGDELSKATSVEGATGKTVTLEAVEVPGYTPENATFEYTFKAEGNEYVFYYTADKQSVVVQYLEEGTDKVLSPPETKNGVTDETLKLEAKEIAGYTVVGEATVNYKLGVDNKPHIFYYTANVQNVTVKYVDRATGDELSKATSVEGATGKTVTLEAVEVPGYTPENATFEYTFKAEGNEYVFYYTADKQSVVVQYLEEGTDKVLSPPETKNGVTDETLKLEAKEIAGYTVVGEATVNYKLGVDNKPHIFYYTANVQNVTVKYVDRATGDELSKATSVEGATGKTVTLEAVEVPGYTPENATFEYTFKAEGNEYVFYYTADKQSVVVQYLEEGTDKVLSPPETKNGVTDETLKLEAKEIAGYTVVGEATVNYKLGVDNKPHIFYYTANVQNVTVKYVDRATGDELSKATSVEGATGKTVTLEAVEVPGYTPENATFEYTFKAEGNEYVFYYTADKQSVVVQYLEEGTEKVLSEPETKDGVTGQKLKLEAKSIAGYTVVGEATVDYTLEVENPAHIFYYTANVQNVTVKYVDRATGDELSKATSVEGATGETVTLKAVDVPGYTPEEATYEYTFKAEGNEHVFYYTKNAPVNDRVLTVRYVDTITGKDLLPADKREGKVGETITLQAQDYTDTVTSAVYKPHVYEATYTFNEDPIQEFVFNYSVDESELELYVTIHHVDRETMEALIDPTVEKGIGGKTLIVHPQPISVTDAVYYPEQLEYGFELSFDPEQEFTIYYNKGEPVDLVQLTVSYLEKGTNAVLAEETIIKGRVEESVKLTAKEVQGYTPEKANDVYMLNGEPNQSYAFYYTKNAPADRQVTVKYLLNGTTQQLATPTTVTGKPGETKTLTAVSISGYTPLKTTASYTFTELEGQEFIFYYTRNSSNPGGGNGSSNNNNNSSSITPLPALPPLPAVPPKLETENHYDYINGYPDGTVKPLNNITREEVAAIFYRLLDDESRKEYLKTTHSFSDVAGTRWSNKHIATMENAGVITGYPDGSFKPGQYITRAEFAAIASRFDKLNEQPNNTFSDITGHWAEKYIVSAANKGWIKGYTDGTFKPDQYITRAEAAAFINSVLNRKVDKDGIHEDAKLWPDNVYGKWYYYEILEATNHHEYSREEEATVEVWEEVLPNRVYP
ncbi:MucBP domain-containing protein [Paenibacillus sp. DYY-L-2]|uniref:MucBP domain-containing protein n=1 Tax=Paenibacillus sp. DYY-L-2 TaxID=3447013 RepID=UPI003F5099CA